MHPRAEYPTGPSIADICTSVGWHLAEVTTLTEANEQSRTTRYGNMYLGVARVNATQQFRTLWSNQVMSFYLWRPLYPTTNVQQACAFQTPQLDWQDVACNTTLSSVGCETEVWPMSGSVTFNYDVAAASLTQIRYIMPGMALFNTTAEASWFYDGFWTSGVPQCTWPHISACPVT